MTKIVNVVAAALFGALMLGASAAHATVAISTQPTVNMTCSNGVCTPTASDAVLNVSDLDGMLANGDTTIKSTAQNPDIEIDAKLSWSSTHKLTLDSYHAIAFNKPVIVLAAGTLTITTNDGGTGGDYRFFGQGHVEFKDVKNGNLFINGHPYYLGKTIKQLTHRKLGDYIAVASNIDAKGHTYTGSPIPEFGGAVFEGLGNTISNLIINGEGFIGTIENGSSVPIVRDLGLLSVNVSFANPSQNDGALAGQNSGLIEYSYATGQVSASGRFAFAGGLVGGSIGTIQSSYADVAVSGTSQVSAVGGLVGLNEGICSPCQGLISQSYATGKVTGGDGMMVGGLVGENLGGAITSSYAKGKATVGNNGFVGGLIGGNIDNPVDQSHPIVSGSYSTGAVSGGTGADVGGLIGEDIAPPAITNTYWDMDTSGINNPAQGAGNVPNDPGITGLSDAQLKSGLPSGFDSNVWAEKTGINKGYPYLIDNAPRK